MMHGNEHCHNAKIKLYGQRFNLLYIHKTTVVTVPKFESKCLVDCLGGANLQISMVLTFILFSATDLKLFHCRLHFVAKSYCKIQVSSAVTILSSTVWHSLSS
jgi:hypothetical protein